MKKRNIKQTMKRDIKKSLFKHHKRDKSKNQNFRGGSSAVYGLGFIGAIVYYIQIATSFWGGVLGFLKALVWPAFLVYELLKFLVA